jgi:hypothetical protein
MGLMLLRHFRRIFFKKSSLFRFFLLSRGKLHEEALPFAFFGCQKSGFYPANAFGLSPNSFKNQQV